MNALDQKRKKEVSLQAKRGRQQNQDSEDDLPDDVLDSQTGKMSVTSDWWRSFVTKEDLETILPSNKLIILFEILKKCQENREKWYRF